MQTKSMYKKDRNLTRTIETPLPDPLASRRSRTSVFRTEQPITARCFASSPETSRSCRASQYGTYKRMNKWMSRLAGYCL